MGWKALTEGPIPKLTDIAATPEGYVAVGFPSEPSDTGPRTALWRSSDGLSWREETYHPPPDADPTDELQSIAATDRGLAALGYPWMGILESTDGTEWERRVLEAEACAVDLAAIDGATIAVGSSGGACAAGGIPGVPAVWASETDGTWTRVDAWPGTGAFRGVATTAGGFVAWGTITSGPEQWTCEIGCAPDLDKEPYAGAPWHSTDGRTWRLPDDPSPFAGALLVGVAGTDEAAVALGFIRDADGHPSELAGWTTEDGAAWSRLENLPFGSADVDARGGALGIGGGGHRVAIWLGVLGVEVWTSEDGRTWDEGAELDVEYLRGVAPLGDGLLAFGQVSVRADGTDEPCWKDEVLSQACRSAGAVWMWTPGNTPD